MKVLFDHRDPFLLAHGGFQIQIEQTKAALERNGVEVEYLRWWDEGQTCDLIQYFGRPPVWYVEFARRKGIKLVFLQLLTGAGSRSRPMLWLQKLAIRSATSFLPPAVTDGFGWKSFRSADGCLANTEWEAHLMSYLFGCPREKMQVISNGVESVFFESRKTERGPWLICTATITERKRVLELAQAAVLARTPLRIVGKPYSPNDPYARQVLELTAKEPSLLRYDGAINDRAELAKAYREARGFVLLSTQETLSLSSSEASACECPLLLSDLPWARTTFGGAATYCPLGSPATTAAVLRRFYDAAPSLPSPPLPPTWNQIGEQLKGIYASLLKTSR